MSNNVIKFVRDELVSFTGMSPDLVDMYISRKKYPHFKEEWNFWKPDSDDNIRWHYVSSRGYIFGNASHILPIDIFNDISVGSKVLDFGGGSGNYSFPLCKKGCSVDYFDINVLQTEFVKYVANKNKMDLTTLGRDDKFVPVVNGRIYDAVLALDVLEHVPNYNEYVSFFARHLKPGGLMYVFAPFGAGGDPTHLNDKHSFKNVMSNNNFKLLKQINLNGGARGPVYKLDT